MGAPFRPEAHHFMMFGWAKLWQSHAKLKVPDIVHELLTVAFPVGGSQSLQYADCKHPEQDDVTRADGRERLPRKSDADQMKIVIASEKKREADYHEEWDR